MVFSCWLAGFFLLNDAVEGDALVMCFVHHALDNLQRMFDLSVAWLSWDGPVMKER